MSSPNASLISSRLELWSPRAAAVGALQPGDLVFALVPSRHSQLPDRQFGAAACDGGRKTIVLDGPTAYGRKVQHMDRLVGSAPL